jgi:SAM-dependent methyltransferase
MKYTKYNKGAIHWEWFDLPGHFYHYLVNNSLKAIASEERGIVLDIGSGDGRVDRILIDLGFSVIGIEPNEEGNKIAKEKVPEMTIINLPLEEAILPKVDYLYSLNTIEHISKPELYLKAMKNVKKFGIVITDNGLLHKGDKFHEREYSLKELKDFFSSFRTEEILLGTPDFIGLKIYA